MSDSVRHLAAGPLLGFLFVRFPPACVVLFGIFCATLFAASNARAQHASRQTDWLLDLPPCALDRHDSPGVDRRGQLLYPRPGLPGVVARGSTLVMRARLSTPRTPPPGFQQRGALVGWQVRLIGRAVAGHEVARPEYDLVVSDLRPDSPKGTVLRVSVQVPEWVAPGTYDIALRAHRGEALWSSGSLRVVDALQEVVFGVLPTGFQLADLSGAEGAERARSLDLIGADVWLSDSEVHEGQWAIAEGAPVLFVNTPGVFALNRTVDFEGARMGLVGADCGAQSGDFWTAPARRSVRFDGWSFASLSSFTLFERPRIEELRSAVRWSESSARELFEQDVIEGNATGTRTGGSPASATFRCELSLSSQDACVASPADPAPYPRAFFSNLRGAFPSRHPLHAFDDMMDIASVELAAGSTLRESRVSRASGSINANNTGDVYELSAPKLIVAGHPARLFLSSRRPSGENDPMTSIWFWGDNESTVIRGPLPHEHSVTVDRVNEEVLHVVVLDDHAHLSIPMTAAPDHHSGCATSKPQGNSFCLLFLAWYLLTRRLKDTAPSTLE